jgi:hypothetical protein
MNRTVSVIVAVVVCASIASAAKETGKGSKGTVHVREYTRKDGTVVSAHERSYPNSGEPKTHSDAWGAPSSSSGAQYGTGTPKSSHPSAGGLSTSSVSSGGIERDKNGRIKRSESAKHTFQDLSPCPATGKTTGKCPGYIIDHVKPLACGGADAAGNMQWQSKEAAAAKDKWERTGCNP